MTEATENPTAIEDPESGKTVRYTDNGPKEGDLPGIDPRGGYLQDLLGAIRGGDRDA